MPNEMSEASGNASVEFRLSLKDAGRDTDLLDSFSLNLTPRLAQLTLGELVDTVFPDDAAAFDEILESLDVKSNPDLPEIYIALSEIFGTWRLGECALRFFSKPGPEILLSQPVRNHLSPSSDGAQTHGQVLDIVVEQTFDVLANFEARGGDKSVLLQWLEGMTLLYFIDKHGFQLQPDTQDEAAQRVLHIASDLQSREILTPSDITGRLEIAEEGRRTLGEMIAETESYIDQFDVFKDVAYDLDDNAVEFGMGNGADYRVQVYDAEGLDVHRTVFLLRMYDGTLDELLNDWLESIHHADFFNEVLRPVLDRERVDDDIIDWIIESGFAHNEEQADRNRERDSQQAIVKRIQP